jgi:hypothetical protein
MIVFQKETIRDEYGEEVWESIQEYLNVDGAQILTNNTYPDVIFSQIVEAVMLFKGEGDYETYMEFFGKKYFFI